MKIVITGTSTGIGAATVQLFLARGHQVFGIDIDSKSPIKHTAYEHCVADVSKKESLPNISQVDILINNAGVQDNDRSLDINFMGVVNCTEKYGLQPNIISIVNVASASARSGAEFPLYAASKGAVVTYTKTIAAQVAEFGATCNSISPGGVYTDLNNHITQNPEMHQAVLNETLLHRWASAEEIAQWIYFVAIYNRSMTAQDILIDNGEMAKFNFIW